MKQNTQMLCYTFVTLLFTITHSLNSTDGSDKYLQTNNSISTPIKTVNNSQKTESSTKAPQVPKDTSGKTKHGREGVILDTKVDISSTPTSINKTQPLKNTTNVEKPVVEPSPEVKEKVHKTIVPKKEAVPTSPKPKPKKPKITESSDDVPFAPSNFESKDKDKSNSSEKQAVQMIKEKRHNSSDYVVPIVAIILSVPLVAIIISVLYKHAADWWQHRNYRRMDFLIEGMYNN